MPNRNPSRTDNPALEDLQSEIIQCEKCPRLVSWRQKIAQTRKKAFSQETYWGKPVPAFGDPRAAILVVGLAPGAHGSNRTGRMFTGDSSGIFLYAALYKSGFANQPGSTHREDGLSLNNMLISAVCRCVPPDNKPTPQEMTACRPYLRTEMDLLPELKVIVALGRIAFDNVLTIFRQRGHPIPALQFAHGATYSLGSGLPDLVAAYHPSRQNTQTGRLTVPMFDEIWIKVRTLVSPE